MNVEDLMQILAIALVLPVFILTLFKIDIADMMSITSKHLFFLVFVFITGKSMSEALIFASTNPQYDNRLFIELPVQYMKIPSSKYTNCVIF